MREQYDAIVIGSGFGGSVAALRLTEKGYRVAVCEQGKRVTPADMTAASNSVRKLLWMPPLGMRGYFSLNFHRHMAVLGGVGVAGGSLVYGAVLLRPNDDFYQDPAWGDTTLDWQQALESHFATAEAMLGVTPNPDFGTQDRYLRDTATALGVDDSFGKVPSGIYYGDSAVEVEDPFFDGRGPRRTGCTRCGECLTGCRYASKNSLDQNYLYLAEAQGATILESHKVTAIRPDPAGGYLVETELGAQIKANKVVLAAGVQGTVELLFRCRDLLGTLPDLSSRLGDRVRTNSESIPVVLDKDEDGDLTEGAAISTHLFFGKHTHVIQNRIPKGHSFMKWQLGPLVPEPNPLKRTLRTLWRFLVHPLQSSVALRARNFHKRITALTVMQQSDNELCFRYSRSVTTGFRKGLVSGMVKDVDPPSYIPEAMEVAQTYAKVSGGIPLDYISSTLLNVPTTAHILGGAIMGATREHGVVDFTCEVFDYPGLYVCDASVIPANLGVNPSLTITAFAERAMSLIPAKH